MDDDRTDEPDMTASHTDRYGQLATLLGVLTSEDPADQLRSAISVGGSDSDVLLLAALKGRFDSVADISKELADDSPWVRSDLLAVAMPEVRVSWTEADIFGLSAPGSSYSGPSTPYDVCYAHKVLHHLRANNCKFRRVPGRDSPECHSEGHVCIGAFEPTMAIGALSGLGRLVVISEYYYVGPDPDQDDSRGGMLDQDELRAMLLAATLDNVIQVHRPIALRLEVPLTGRRYNAVVGDALRYADHLVLSMRRRERLRTGSTTRARAGG